MRNEATDVRAEIVLSQSTTQLGPSWPNVHVYRPRPLKPQDEDVLGCQTSRIICRAVFEDPDVTRTRVGVHAQRPRRHRWEDEFGDWSTMMLRAASRRRCECRWQHWWWFGRSRHDARRPWRSLGINCDDDSSSGGKQLALVVRPLSRCWLSVGTESPSTCLMLYGFSLAAFPEY